MILRDYQIQCLDSIKTSYDKGINRQLVVLPTGTGKTAIFSNLPQKMHKPKMLVLAHREELLEQAKNKITEFNPDLYVDIEQAERHASFQADVVIASVPTLGRTNSNRIKDFNPSEFQTIIVDESHHSTASSYRNILGYFGVFEDKSKLMVGWTATPKRGDNVGLDAIFQDVVFHRDIREMIESKWLCPITAYRIKTSSDISNVAAHAGDFSEKELSEAVDTESRNKLILDVYKSLCQNRRTLIFCVNVKHTQNVAKTLLDAKIDCGIVLGNTDRQIRAKTLSDFASGHINVVANCAVLTEGYDLPQLSAIIMARPTQSGLLYTQMLGRGTRIAENKENLLVLDLVDNSSKHQVMTASSMFGLPLNFDSKGKDVLELSKEVEEQLSKTPGLPMDKFANIDDLKTYLEKFSLFTAQSRIDSDVEKYSELTWIQIGEKYFIPLSKTEKLILHKNMLNKYEFGMSQFGTNHRIEIADDLENGFKFADKYVKATYPDLIGLYLKSARWRKDAASDKQKLLLRSFGIQFPETITKGEASNIITREFNKK